MSEKFVFHGQTTFIDKPRETVIQNFQNTYIGTGDTEIDKINTELKSLIELIFSSKDLSKEDKEETVQAVHAVADQVKEQKGSKLTLKGTLQAIKDVVTTASDIAGPAAGIITTILKLIGLI